MVSDIVVRGWRESDQSCGGGEVQCSISGSVLWNEYHHTQHHRERQ